MYLCVCVLVTNKKKIDVQIGELSHCYKTEYTVSSCELLTTKNFYSFSFLIILLLLYEQHFSDHWKW